MLAREIGCSDSQVSDWVKSTRQRVQQDWNQKRNLAILFPDTIASSFADVSPPKGKPQGKRLAVSFYVLFRVRKIPTIAPIRIIGAALTNSHSNA